MGQCMSRKAVTAFTTSAVVIHQQNYHNMSNRLMSPEEESKPSSMKKQLSKGIATSFGFRKRSPTSPQPPPTQCTLTTNNPTAARRLANTIAESLDSNGNSGLTPHNISTIDTAPLTTNAVPSARSTPHRLPAPKKEAQATTKPSRFGFRQPNANRLNRVADININPPARIEYGNINIAVDTKEREQIESEIKAKVEMQQRQMVNATDSNKNRNANIGKYTLHSNQLPRPQPVKLLESKTAKTLANNTKKQSGNISAQRNAGTSGDESYFTEDSGVGSNCGDNIKQLEKSPMSRRLKTSKFVKPRTLEVVVNRNKFDVRDIDVDIDETSETPIVPLPGLPTLSTLSVTSSNYQRVNTGIVRDRAAEYQRNVIDKKDNRSPLVRKTSFTSSEASSHCEEDLSFKRIEKIAKFIKQKPHGIRDPNSSDDQMWASHAGEAMAEEYSSLCPSSSDESRDKVPVLPAIPNIPTMEASIEVLISAKAQNRLSLVDPKFAAIAASTISAPLILDEPSPVDSINCSSSSENNDSAKMTPDNDQKMNSASMSNSKDVNEKNTGSSPGSPTNASNSLSLSDGREDFLIDDEIADQPALLFDDTITNSTQQSEATPTIVDSTPKPARRAMGVYESSPLSLKNRRFGRTRAGSLDTLSPCESIASDDCMMDYDMSSGIEDANDRTETNGHFTLDDVPVRTVDLKITNVMRDWSSLLSGCDISRDTSKRMSFRSSRLLKSRGATPTSSVPDSPRSDAMRRTSVSQSPLRLSSSRSSTGTGTGYDSDDSAVIRIDRTILQDVMGIKTSLLKLKRVLHEPAIEDNVLRSETHSSLSENGFFNGYGSDSERDPEEVTLREEMANLRRQVVYLQGQLDDSERTTKHLREEMTTLSLKYESSQSAPASVTTAATTTNSVQAATCNAATQTERIRPISAGPTLLQDANDLSPGSLVSVSEQNQASSSPSPSSTAAATARSSRQHHQSPKSSSQLQPPGRLWRMPGEPPSPSAIPRRSCSRSRVANTSLTTTSTTTPT